MTHRKQLPSTNHTSSYVLQYAQLDLVVRGSVVRPCVCVYVTTLQRCGGIRAVQALLFYMVLSTLITSGCSDIVDV